MNRRTLNAVLLAALALAGIGSLLVVGCGCTRSLDYSTVTTRPDGTVVREDFHYANTGFDTKAGKIDVRKDGPKIGVTLENLDSQAKALELAGKAVDVLGAAARGNP